MVPCHNHFREHLPKFGFPDQVTLDICLKNKCRAMYSVAFCVLSSVYNNVRPKTNRPYLFCPPNSYWTQLCSMYGQCSRYSRTGALNSSVPIIFFAGNVRIFCTTQAPNGLSATFFSFFIQQVLSTNDVISYEQPSSKR